MPASPTAVSSREASSVVKLEPLPFVVALLDAYRIIQIA